jgi:lysophospholipase L1-like esterase
LLRKAKLMSCVLCCACSSTDDVLLPVDAEETASTTSQNSPAASSNTPAEASARATVSTRSTMTTSTAMKPPTGEVAGSAPGTPPNAGAGAIGHRSAGSAAPAAGTRGGNGAAGMATAGTTSTTAGAGGAAEPASCLKGQVKASEVVFIGESFIAQSGEIPRQLNMLAQKAGTIGADESYRSFAVSGTQLTTGEIPDQFVRAAMDGPVKVVLMDGGGNDLLWGDRCKNSSFDAMCKEVVDVVAKLFTRFKTDGVKDVVYFFYPDPQGIGAMIKDAMDLLRPEMKKLCDEATDVRCIWVDQRDSWMDHYDEYTSDGIHPTTAGFQSISRTDLGCDGLELRGSISSSRSGCAHGVTEEDAGRAALALALHVIADRMERSE